MQLIQHLIVVLCLGAEDEGIQSESDGENT